MPRKPVPNDGRSRINESDYDCKRSRLRGRRSGVAQVRFLVHTIKQTQQQIGGEVTVEEIWQTIERREMEVFNENVQDLRPAVFAALGVGDEKTG